MNYEKVRTTIVNWLNDYGTESGVAGFVVGVSGGIDSAVVSTLCAMTGAPVTLLNMPILQNPEHVSRADKHIEWLESRFTWAHGYNINLTKTFATFCEDMPIGIAGSLGDANSRSRLRMMTLYAFANTENKLVVGTGNKVEDHGVRFFTKYGDGGVDLSPIGELTKTEVRNLARHMGIHEDIIKASPSDGLWDDGRTDEDQLGASYEELEWAMNFYDGTGKFKVGPLSDRETAVLKIYRDWHLKGAHKMKMPPVCKIG